MVADVFPRHIAVLWGPGTDDGAARIERRDFWATRAEHLDAIAQYLQEASETRGVPYSQVRYQRQSGYVSQRPCPATLVFKNVAAGAVLVHVGAATPVIRVLAEPDPAGIGVGVAYVYGTWRVAHVVQGAQHAVCDLGVTAWTPVPSSYTFADLADAATLGDLHAADLDELGEGDVLLPTIWLRGAIIPSFLQCSIDAEGSPSTPPTTPPLPPTPGGTSGGSRFPADFPAPPDILALPDADPADIQDLIADRTRFPASVPPPRGPLLYAPGRIGLINENHIQCYCNSVVQALAHTPLFKDFFVRNKYDRGLNVDNPLGSGGHLSLRLGELVCRLWGCTYTPLSSMQLFNAAGRFRYQFDDHHSQQDAQELLAALLDGLHEDYNEVQKRILVPKYEPRDEDLTSVEDVAEECWLRYLLRNRSPLVQHCMGQLKSTLQCKVCGKGDITFDAYNTLALELPDSNPMELVSWLYFPAGYPSEKAVVLQRCLPSFLALRDLKKETYEVMGRNPTERRSLWAYVNYHHVGGKDTSFSAVTVDRFLEPLPEGTNLTQVASDLFTGPRAQSPYKWLALFESPAGRDPIQPQVPVVVNAFEDTNEASTLHPVVLLMDEGDATAENVMRELCRRYGTTGQGDPPRHADPLDGLAGDAQPAAHQTEGHLRSPAPTLPHPRPALQAPFSLHGAGWDETGAADCEFCQPSFCAGCSVWPRAMRKALVETGKRRHRQYLQRAIGPRDQELYRIFDSLVRLPFVSQALRMHYPARSPEDVQAFVIGDCFPDTAAREQTLADPRRLRNLVEHDRDFKERWLPHVPRNWGWMRLDDLALSMLHGAYQHFLSGTIYSGALKGEFNRCAGELEATGGDRLDVLRDMPFGQLHRAGVAHEGYMASVRKAILKNCREIASVVDYVPEDVSAYTAWDLAGILSTGLLRSRYGVDGWDPAEACVRPEADAAAEMSDNADSEASPPRHPSEGAEHDFVAQAVRLNRAKQLEDERQQQSPFAAAPDPASGLWHRPIVLKADFKGGSSTAEASIPEHLRLLMRRPSSQPFREADEAQLGQGGDWSHFSCDARNQSHAARYERREKKVYKLEECLGMFTRTEKLDEGDAWKCPRCVKQQPSKKKIEIWNVPNMLILHIKRFASAGGLSTRLNHAVDFPFDDLDLSEYLAQRGITARSGSELVSPVAGPSTDYFAPSPISHPLSAPEPSGLFPGALDPPSSSQNVGSQQTLAPGSYEGKYRLLCIVAHKGPDIQCGHYTATCYDPKQRAWFEYDDALVSERSVDEIKKHLARNVYLLVYVRKDYETFSWKEPCEWPDLADVLARVEEENAKEEEKDRRDRERREAGEQEERDRSALRRGGDGDTSDEPEPKRQRVPDAVTTAREGRSPSGEALIRNLALD